MYFQLYLDDVILFVCHAFAVRNFLQLFTNTTSSQFYGISGVYRMENVQNDDGYWNYLLLHTE